MKKLLCLLIILGLGGLVICSFRGKLPAASFLETEEDSSIRAIGTIEIQEVDIAPKTTGYSVLAVDEGDNVGKGQLLAKIDRPDLRATLERDRASTEKAMTMLMITSMAIVRERGPWNSCW
jgi:multidrug efflux pump subunit AcrA (membrane-fusion protein)